jgi:anti-sigma-K factor RskA
MNSYATVVLNRRIDDIYKPSKPSPRAARAVEAGTRTPDCIIDVSRPVLPWRWTSVVLAPVELVAIAWSVPFVILSVGIPFVLVVALVHQVGRFISSYF